ncbi:mitochondrial carrier domain-containing protein [Dipodascopsis tothii]|uniref:mitochondrial carrier domain-containing protein n=1 Tax=Dipodascopsis tothii TaxID=44089 RepID=UPI0034CE6481
MLSAGGTTPPPEAVVPDQQPLVWNMIAGGIGGGMGDATMHSLDTVKTRQQGASGAKYRNMLSAYGTILREEGVMRGLYGGFAPAMIGSLPGNTLFFGTYETSKRLFIGWGLPETPAHLLSGFLGDLAASVIYVPSEVLKARLQLQGRHNNPHYTSGYNYRGTWDALVTIVREEKPSALFFGYKATLIRDLPCSALQFAFYERFHAWARLWADSRDIGVPLELATGAAAGGLAGIITTPLDLIKTRIQTQLRTETKPLTPPGKPAFFATTGAAAKAAPAAPAGQRSLHTAQRTVSKLESESTLQALRAIYRHEGLAGLFAGIGPRFIWMSTQSSIMLFVYQSVLRVLEDDATRPGFL